MSHNHQYIEYDTQIVRRYAKTTVGMLTGYRVDPKRPENRIDWLLSSPSTSFIHTWSDGDTPKLTRAAFKYEDEVIELYSNAEIRLFERWNKRIIEEGLLRVYDEAAPDTSTINLVSDDELNAVAKIKQLTALKKKIGEYSSTYTLTRLKEAVERADRPISVIKLIEARINELSRSN